MAYYRDSVTEGSYFEDEEEDDEGAASFREAEMESTIGDSEVPRLLLALSLSPVYVDIVLCSCLKLSA